MSLTLHGLAVSPGIAIGQVHLLSHAVLEVSHYVIPARHVESEMLRFDAAVDTVRGELDAIKTSAGAGAPAEIVALVDLHALILEDPTLARVPRQVIEERRCNAEWALVQQMEHLVEQFEEIDDPYLRERKADVVQVVERVLKALMGRPRNLQRRKHEDGSIVVAHDLSPADTFAFRQHQVAGFATDLGGATSHTAIVARSLGIPAVVGLHRVRQLLRDDEYVIIDGTRGVVIVDPDERVLDEYRLRKSGLELERSKLRRLKSARAATLDGEDVALHANIELPEDVSEVRAVDAAGVGLYRTEFLFLGRDELPGEEEQFEAYRAVAQAMKGKPVTIRTLDVGADKGLRGGKREEPNPALGLRAIRYCLAEPALFLTQLRAILRASHHGKVRILLPMIAHAHEVDQALAVIEQAKAQLRAARQKFDEGVEVGGMIEIPAAALSLPMFVKRLAFLSIGTNDLIQYTLAIDRTNEAVAALYDPVHPAVLRLISQTILTGSRSGIDVSVCGEMAGNPQLTRLLIGMGLRIFSMHPAQILEVKQEILLADAGDLVNRVQRLLRTEEPERLREQIERLNERAQ